MGWKQSDGVLFIHVASAERPVAGRNPRAGRHTYNLNTLPNPSDIAD